MHDNQYYSGGGSSVTTSSIGVDVSAAIPLRSGAAVERSVTAAINALVFCVTISFVPEIVGTLPPRPSAVPRPPRLLNGFVNPDPGPDPGPVVFS